MKNNIKKKELFLVLIVFFQCSLVIAQNNTLFIDDGSGGGIYIRNASGGTLATHDASTALYIDGDFTNEGIYDNESAEIRIRGNLSNTGTFMTIGDEVIESGDTNIISGNFTGSNNFHNLIIYKPGTSVTELNTNVNIGAAGILAFTAAGGILQVNSGSRIFVMNPSASSIVGYSSSGGDRKFIRGTLIRGVTTGVVYDLPVGNGVHGHQLVQIDFTDLSGGTWVSARYNNSSFGAVSGNQFCDVVDNSAADELQYDEQLGTWNINSNGTNGSYDYEVTLVPAGTNVFTNSVTHDAMLKDGIYQNCSSATGNYSKSGLTGFSSFTMQGGTVIIPLPVELLGFYANPIDNKYVALNWDVASELNAEKYEIQRSVNGVDFFRIGDVSAIESDTYFYDDFDVRPNIAYLYRLKMIDFDGSFEYSDVASARINGDGIQIISFPNPTQAGKVNLTLETDVGKKVSIYVYTVLGQILYKQSVNLEDGINHIQFPSVNWSVGTYFLSIKDEQNIESRKFILQH